MSGSGWRQRFGFVIAAALFAGDLTLRQYVGHGLAAMRFLTGALLITDWLAVCIAAAYRKAAVRKGQPGSQGACHRAHSRDPLAPSGLRNFTALYFTIIR